MNGINTSETIMIPVYGDLNGDLQTQISTILLGTVSYLRLLNIIFLKVTALIMIPIILLPKPIIASCRSKKKNISNDSQIDIQGHDDSMA